MTKAINSGYILAGRLRKLLKQLRISTTAGTTALAVAALAAISMLAVVLALPSKMIADDHDAETFTVDVGFRSLFYQNNVDPAETVNNKAAFSPGDTFIQYGNIFPAGTIPEDQTDFDPDTAPGKIGVYLARGTWTTDLPDFLNAVGKMRANPDLAFATEIFSFDNNRGTVLTDGILPNAHFSARRVVLGGTRNFRDIVGEVHEQNIGENKTTLACNLRVTFKLRNVSEGRGR